MDKREECNLLALVFQIQIRILSIASPIRLQNNLSSIDQISSGQLENAKTRKMLAAR